jgi:hypothetical protein
MFKSLNDDDRRASRTTAAPRASTGAPSIGKTHTLYMLLIMIRNTPALDFYKKCGAKLEEGHVSLRMDRDDLRDFVHPSKSTAPSVKEMRL